MVVWNVYVPVKSGREVLIGTVIAASWVLAQNRAKFQWGDRAVVRAYRD